MQYQFDLYTLDTARFKLRMGEESLHCEPQAIALLGPLIENHDRMVSKEEINQTIIINMEITVTKLPES